MKNTDEKPAIVSRGLDALIEHCKFIGDTSLMNYLKNNIELQRNTWFMELADINWHKKLIKINYFVTLVLLLMKFIVLFHLKICASYAVKHFMVAKM